MAVVAVLAVAGYRPRTSRPFRVSHLFGLWLNWPLLTFVLLVASTVLAIAQSGLSMGVWIGVALTAIASAALVVLRREAQQTGPTCFAPAASTPSSLRSRRSRLPWMPCRFRGLSFVV